MTPVEMIAIVCGISVLVTFVFLHMTCRLGHSKTNKVGFNSMSGYWLYNFDVFVCGRCRKKYWYFNTMGPATGRVIKYDVQISDEAHKELSDLYTKIQGYTLTEKQKDEIIWKTNDILVKYGLGEKFPFERKAPVYNEVI